MGGDLEAESTEGAGSRFTLRLRRAALVDGPVQPEQQPQTRPPARNGNGPDDIPGGDLSAVALVRGAG